MDALLAVALVVATTALLISERLRADLVAMVVLSALILLRLVEPAQALSGFANPATVTVACMFVISAGLESTGIVGFLGDRLLLHGPSGRTALLTLTGLVIAPLSAFVNNTAVVAVFLPIIQRASQGNGISPSSLMMPLSFFAMLGGMCTLLGTSTNLVVNSIAVEHGLAPFGMFEFTRLGLITLAAGAAYLLAFGGKLLPRRPVSEDPALAFGLHHYLSEVVVVEGSPLIGQSLFEAKLGERYHLEVFGHTRDQVMRSVPDGYESLREGDILAVRAPVEALMRLEATAGLAVRPRRHPDVAGLRAADSVIVEAVITPNSDLKGRTLKEVNFRRRYGATALAIRRGEDVREKIGRIRLRVGDELLIVAPKRSLDQLKSHESFVILQELDVPLLRPRRAILACLIAAGVVAVATAGWYPISQVAIVGAVLMVVAGCLPARRLYHEIDWTVIFMLAGLIPLGLALESSGAAAALVRGMLALTGGFGPHFVLGAFVFVAALLTGFMSNAATAVLLGPLAITIAQHLGVDARPFLIALTFAASAAFWTPIGYQTNMLVYAPGGYRFGDYVRIGGPLALLYGTIVTLLVPVMFPFG